MEPETRVQPNGSGLGASWWQRVKAAARQSATAQKPAPGVPAYTRWINRPVARLVASVAFVAHWTPNAVTLTSLCLSAVGIIVLLTGPVAWWSGLVIALFLALGYLFDSADGQLARLSGTGGAAGEWFDHVVDALRTPALHLAVGIAAWLQFENVLLTVVALATSVLMSGQFMSQMLAEQLLKHRGADPRRGGTRQSWILLPTDPGTWAWAFIFWGSPSVFASLYITLAVINVLHVAVSMVRRYRDLMRASHRE